VILFIGGPVGAGKTTLAKGLARTLSIRHYEIDPIKDEIYPSDPDYSYNLEHKIPFSNETRRRVFERAVADFAILSRDHTHMVVDEVLHKRDLRQILFDGADIHFGGHMIIWVQADEDIVRQRLAKPREGHMLDDPFEWHLVYKKQYEDFEKPDIIYHNNKPIQEAIRDLSILVQTKAAERGVHLFFSS
jgi:predicted kinase